MGRFVNPDNSAFQVALNSPIYVDKTGLLEYTNSVLNTTEAYICNSRPRRFGKSYAANMLAAYYSKGCNSEEMFSGLDISRESDFKTHLNKYDVIHIDIQWFLANCEDVDNVVTLITDSVLSELREIYPDIFTWEVSRLPDALSIVREKTGQKFIIIIDEWDVLIRDAATNGKVQEAYINFLRGMFKGTEPTKYIQLAYLTGILPVKKEKTQSALNNFDEFTMLSASNLAPYIGFTEDEVEKLSKEYHQDFDKVKRWYDGYLLKDYQIYNPRAVVGVMLKGEFKSYWSETASYEAVTPLINMNYDGLKTAIIEMLSGANVKVDTATFKNDTVNIHSKDDVLTYMIHLGYLGYDFSHKSVFIPNNEIRGEFVNAVSVSQWGEVSKALKNSADLLNAIWRKDEEKVAVYMEQAHFETSHLQYNNENALSCTINLAFYFAREYYTIVRELPTGKGFADIVMIPRKLHIDKPAVVIELKWDKSVSGAIEQIKRNEYIDVLRDYKGNLLLAGINYSKKTKKHTCMIEQVQL